MKKRVYLSHSYETFPFYRFIVFSDVYNGKMIFTYLFSLS